ncbi:RNA polymerase sigma-54 factor RpoN [Salisediminibacterium beveridgei]|uniref:RNA polymerase sigma-54 factor RpoN n=2 Tax=Salisediminibacterium beveridgei TaxID=632773 RepID=A0A1D7QSJ8_9BACI|nr:RNA polymerase sigma-54 factor RpoN [Salisediminibacterium beveridgei]
MNMDYGLHQHQSMKLVMTTELRQAITMLQFSTQDLTDYLHEQQLENPLIEIRDPVMYEEVTRRETADSFRQLDRNSGQKRQETNVTALDYLTEPEEGLKDHLLHQIRMMDAENETKQVMTYLALSLNENGYLEHGTDVYAQELNVLEKRTEHALQMLQTLDPPGIAARNLTECLMIQLTQLATKDPLAEAVVADHLDQLAERQFKKIAKALDVGVEDVEAVADFLKTLNPKPGASFHSEPAEYVAPDVHVIDVNGSLHVKLAENHLPKLTMNKQYEQLLSDGGSEVAHYMKQKHEQFQWLKKSIRQRQETILKVTEAIVRHQEAFFLHGAEYLNPLNLKTIAEELDIHESTVSRATSKKYVQSPRGLYELKYFFKSGIAGSDGTGDSADKIKVNMKRLIDEEEKKKPLSDQKLAELLALKEIHVSRRTVAKYREELSIPSSSKRKRFS